MNHVILSSPVYQDSCNCFSVGYWLPAGCQWEIALRRGGQKTRRERLQWGSAYRWGGRKKSQLQILLAEFGREVFGFGL